MHDPEGAVSPDFLGRRAPTDEFSAHLSDMVVVLQWCFLLSGCPQSSLGVLVMGGDVVSLPPKRTVPWSSIAPEGAAELYEAIEGVSTDV